ncbi:hypothetical protein Ahy_B05g077238 [Arachis hypogaea]|uniref:Uncharacterized protein n=1 Tax=Arachis hypogaea TaxID=3818 RepID=A0A444Z4P4_ARAHY|nr:hypothetical protein Ahy_B05g077238 [Arachis hypogaea]
MAISTYDDLLLPTTSPPATVSSGNVSSSGDLLLLQRRPPATSSPVTVSFGDVSSCVVSSSDFSSSGDLLLRCSPALEISSIELLSCEFLLRQTHNIVVKMFLVLYSQHVSNWFINARVRLEEEQCLGRVMDTFGSEEESFFFRSLLSVVAATAGFQWGFFDSGYNSTVEAGHHSSLFYATTIDAAIPTIVGMAPKNQDAINAAIVGMLADPKEARAGIRDVHFLPFNPVDKRTSLTYIDADGNWHRASKGAPEQIMNLCNLRDDAKKKVYAIIDKFAERGLRSLAISRQVLTSKSSCFNFSVYVPKFLVNNNNKENLNLKHLLCYCRKLGMGTNMYPSASLLGQDKDASIAALPVEELIEKADKFAGVFPGSYSLLFSQRGNHGPHYNWVFETMVESNAIYIFRITKISSELLFAFSFKPNITRCYLTKYYES